MEELVRECSLSALDKADDNTEETESRAENFDDEKAHEGLWSLGVRESEAGSGNANTDTTVLG